MKRKEMDSSDMHTRNQRVFKNNQGAKLVIVYIDKNALCLANRTFVQVQRPR
jgi:hypothetical protein